VHFFTGILEHFSEIDTFRVIQEKKDEIQLIIVPCSPITPEIEKSIIQALQEKGAKDLKIEIQIVSDIPLQSSGKRRFVINNLEN
jgi:hypothetical protein